MGYETLVTGAVTVGQKAAATIGQLLDDGLRMLDDSPARLVVQGAEGRIATFFEKVRRGTGVIRGSLTNPGADAARGAALIKTSPVSGVAPQLVDDLSKRGIHVRVAAEAPGHLRQSVVSALPMDQRAALAKLSFMDHGV